MKRTLTTVSIILLGSLSLYACGDDDDAGPTGGSGGKSGQSGASGASGTGGTGAGSGGSAGAAGSASGSGGTGGSSGQAGAGGQAGGGAGAGGEAGSSQAGSGGQAGASGAGGSGQACEAVYTEHLDPIDKISEGKVFVVSDAGGVKTIFIDGSAGGSSKASLDLPRVYVSLSDAKRIDVTDVSARQSSDWDVSFERTIVFGNGGDGGVGARETALIKKDFDAVTTADIAGAAFGAEDFFEADCTPKVDQANFMITRFSPDWYTYGGTGLITPLAGQTYLVRRPGGATFKFSITSYYTSADGAAQPPPASPAEINPLFNARTLIRVATLVP